MSNCLDRKAQTTERNKVFYERILKGRNIQLIQQFTHLMPPGKNPTTKQNTNTLLKQSENHQNKTKPFQNKEMATQKGRTSSNGENFTTKTAPRHNEEPPPNQNKQKHHINSCSTTNFPFSKASDQGRSKAQRLAW